MHISCNAMANAILYSPSTPNHILGRVTLSKARGVTNHTVFNAYGKRISQYV